MSTEGFVSLVCYLCVSMDYPLGSASPKTEGCWTPYKDLA